MITNRSVTTTIKNKDGKILKKVEQRNMILDNFLSYMNFKVFPQRFALYPEYTGNDFGDAPMKFCYLTTANQNINEQSKTMSFDLKEDYNASVTNSLSTFEKFSNSFVFNMQYSFTIPSSLNGETIKGLGFGGDDTTIDDFLFAFIDVSSIDLVLEEGFVVEVRREDRLTTEGEFLPGVTQQWGQGSLHLGINNFQLEVGADISAELERICLCDESGDVIFTATTDELTLTRDGGIVEITGFPTINLSDHGLLYPSDDLYIGWEVLSVIDDIPEEPFIGSKEGYRWKGGINIAFNLSDYFTVGQEILTTLDGNDYFLKVDEIDDGQGHIYFDSGGVTLPFARMENIRVIKYELYPTPPNKIKFIEYTYVVEEYDFGLEEFIVLDRYKLKNELIDVDFTFNGGTFTIKHFYERGDA